MIRWDVSLEVRSASREFTLAKIALRSSSSVLMDCGGDGGLLAGGFDDRLSIVGDFFMMRRGCGGFNTNSSSANREVPSLGRLRVSSNWPNGDFEVADVEVWGDVTGDASLLTEVLMESSCGFSLLEVLDRASGSRGFDGPGSGVDPSFQSDPRFGFDELLLKLG